MSNFRLLPTFIIVVVLLSVSTLCLAQWQQTSGPYGVEVHSITNSGDTLYAGTGGGLYQLVPGRKAWELIAFSSHSVSDVWATSSRLYAGLIDTMPNALPGSLLYSSTDRGHSWTISSGVFSHPVMKFWALATIHDAGHEVTYISASFVTIGGFNLFSSSSSDTGTWTPVTSTSGLPNLGVRALISINDTLYAATGGGVFVKEPGVPMWKRLSGIPSTVIATGIHFDGSTMYVGTSDGVYYSIDRKTWTNNQSLVDIRSFATLGSITVGDDSLQYYFTTDHGLRWSQVPSTANVQGHDGLLARSGNLVIGTQKAIYTLASPSFALTRIDSGIINNDVYSLTLIGNKLYARTKEGFAWTSDAGDTWHELATESRPGSTQYLTSSANHLFVGGTGLFRTTNDGVTWDTLKGGFNNFQTVNALAASDSTIYVGTSEPQASGIYISRDLGATWTSVDTQITDLVYAIYADGPRVIVLGNNWNYRSTDHGVSWTKQPPPEYSGQVGISVAGSRDTIIANAKGILRSVDGGLNWNSVTEGLPEADWVDRVFMSGNVAVAGSMIGVYYSNDAGAHWRSSNAGLTDETPAAAFDANYLYAGTFGSSMWRLPRILATVFLDESTAALSIYPNPARSNVSIVVSGNTTATSHILLYDALGRLVRQFAVGARNISFGGLGNGVYHVELRDVNNGALHARQKLVIVR